MTSGPESLGVVVPIEAPGVPAAPVEGSGFTPPWELLATGRDGSATGLGTPVVSVGVSPEAPAHDEAQKAKTTAEIARTDGWGRRQFFIIVFRFTRQGPPNRDVLERFR